MNPSALVERRVQLALGIEPLDAMRHRPIDPSLFVVSPPRLSEAERVRLEREGLDVTDFLRQYQLQSRRQSHEIWLRHRSSRHTVVYGSELLAGANNEVAVRVVEGAFRTAPRRYVPRAFRIPLLDPVRAARRPTRRRLRRPWIFPGAAYECPESTSAIRGRAVRGGEGVRWVRVIAVRTGSTEEVGRAQGDDRGEFLLLLSRVSGGAGNTLDVTLTVSARPVIAPPDELTPKIDPYWDLPEEALTLSSPADPVATGEDNPTGYIRQVTRRITVRLGRVRSLTTPFEIPA